MLAIPPTLCSKHELGDPNYRSLSEPQFPYAISHHPHSDLLVKDTDFSFHVAPKYNILSDAQPQIVSFSILEE